MAHSAFHSLLFSSLLYPQLMSSTKRKDSPTNTSGEESPTKNAKQGEHGYYLLNWSIEDQLIRSGKIFYNEQELHEYSKEVVREHFQRLRMKTIQVKLREHEDDEDFDEDFDDDQDQEQSIDQFLQLNPLKIRSVRFSVKDVSHLLLDELKDIQKLIHLLRNVKPSDYTIEDLRWIFDTLQMEMDGTNCPPKAFSDTPITLELETPEKD